MAFNLTPAPGAECRHGSQSCERGFIASGGVGLRTRIRILRWTGKLPNPKRSGRSVETYLKKPLKKEVF